MPLSLDDIKREEAESARHAATACDAWLAKPEIKLLVSLLPPLSEGTQRDCFNALLWSCFAAGTDAGATRIVGSLARAMTGRDKPR